MKFITKPMLAAAITSVSDYNKVNGKLPLLASVKLDGIRALYHSEALGFVSRKFKLIPNDHIRNYVERYCLPGTDGELVTFNKDGTLRTFNEIQGDVMRKSGTPDFKYIIFDSFRTPDREFTHRLADAQYIVDHIDDPDKAIRYLDHKWVKTMDEMYEAFDSAMDKGYEGLMLRNPYGPYKCGRSTVNQMWLVKIKQFADAEGIVIGFEERQHNGNEAKKDATGHTERSSCKANMVPMGTLGALVLDTEWGELKVGSGFSDDMRKGIWESRAEDHALSVLGKMVTFTYQPYGAKDKPRFPIFKGFRHKDDT